MDAQGIVLDEIVWRSAPVAQMMGGVHENSGSILSMPLSSGLSR